MPSVTPNTISHVLNQLNRIENKSQVILTENNEVVVVDNNFEEGKFGSRKAGLKRMRNFLDSIENKKTSGIKKKIFQNRTITAKQVKKALQHYNQKNDKNTSTWHTEQTPKPLTDEDIMTLTAIKLSHDALLKELQITPENLEQAKQQLTVFLEFIDNKLQTHYHNEPNLEYLENILEYTQNPVILAGLMDNYSSDSVVFQKCFNRIQEQITGLTTLTELDTLSQQLNTCDIQNTNCRELIEQRRSAINGDSVYAVVSKPKRKKETASPPSPQNTRRKAEQQSSTPAASPAPAKKTIRGNPLPDTPKPQLLKAANPSSTQAGQKQLNDLLELLDLKSFIQADGQLLVPMEKWQQKLQELPDRLENLDIDTHRTYFGFTTIKAWQYAARDKEKNQLLIALENTGRQAYGARKLRELINPPHSQPLNEAVKALGRKGYHEQIRDGINAEAKRVRYNREK